MGRRRSSWGWLPLVLSAALYIHCCVPPAVPVGSRPPALRRRLTEEHEGPHATAEGETAGEEDEPRPGEYELLEKVIKEVESAKDETKHWTTVGLFGVIIVLSIAFEVMQEAAVKYLKRTHQTQYLKMIDALFKELTILGFVGLVMMSLVKSGVMDLVNEMYFEEAEERRRRLSEMEHSHPSELAELFEDVHVCIFIIMVVFILLVSLLLVIAVMQQRKFLMGEGVRQKDIHEKIVGESNLSTLRKSVYVDLLVYRILRREFFHPSIGQAHRRVRPASFHFHVYLGLCMSEFVVELIEIPPFCYTTVMFCLPLTLPLMELEGFSLVLAFTIISWAMLVVLLLICSHLFQTFEQMLPENHPTLQNPIPMEYELVGTRGSQRPQFYNNAMRSSKNFLRVAMCGTGAPTKHESLFYFWRNGPAVLGSLIQLMLFGQACYIAIVLRVALVERELFMHYKYFVLLQVLPLVGSWLFLWPKVLFYFTIVTSVNQMKNEENIEQTVGMIEHRQYLKYEILIQELKTHALIFDIASMDPNDHATWMRKCIEQYTTEMSTEFVEQCDQAFRRYDTSGNDQIDRLEMKCCLVAQGKSEQDADTICDNWFNPDVFRECGEEGELTLQEFQALSVTLEELRIKGPDDDAITKWLNAVLDVSGDGTVSTDEFIHTLPDVCRHANLDLEGLHELFFCIGGETQEDRIVDEVEVSKFTSWLLKFAASRDGSDDTEEEEHGH